MNRRRGWIRIAAPVIIVASVSAVAASALAASGGLIGVAGVAGLAGFTAAGPAAVVLFASEPDHTGRAERHLPAQLPRRVSGRVLFPTFPFSPHELDIELRTPDGAVVGEPIARSYSGRFVFDGVPPGIYMLRGGWRDQTTFQRWIEVAAAPATASAADAAPAEIEVAAHGACDASGSAQVGTSPRRKGSAASATIEATTETPAIERVSDTEMADAVRAAARAHLEMKDGVRRPTPLRVVPAAGLPPAWLARFGELGLTAAVDEAITRVAEREGKIYYWTLDARPGRGSCVEVSIDGYFRYERRSRIISLCCSGRVYALHRWRDRWDLDVVGMVER